jgi:hypothetical protein
MTDLINLNNPSVYLYVFYEDGTIEINMFPPTEGDIDAIEEGLIDVIKIEPEKLPLIYNESANSETNWHPLTDCEFINVCGSLCHMPSGSEPYNDEEE